MRIVYGSIHVHTHLCHYKCTHRTHAPLNIHTYTCTHNTPYVDFIPDSPPMTGLLSKCSSSSDTVLNLPKPKLNSFPPHLTGKCFTEFLALREREEKREERGERGRKLSEGGKERERERVMER